MRRIYVKKLIATGTWNKKETAWVLDKAVKLEPNKDYMLRITDNCSYVDTFYVCPDDKGRWTVSAPEIDDKGAYLMFDDLTGPVTLQGTGSTPSKIEVFSLNA